MAACLLVPSVGAVADTYICDNGASPGLSDPGGNNVLTFPVGGTGVINGAVSFGPGDDKVFMHSGQVTGAVSQGAGVDDFVMTGGQIQALQQGDGYDSFNMSGGTIVGAFEDGDNAVMSGGTIGRVDMKLADNFFYLSNGRIYGNLITGFGLDTIEVSGGAIGGNLSVSGGNDIIRLTGGTISGEIRMSFGNDKLEWTGGGAVFDHVLMGQDFDTATLRNLTEATLSVTPSIDGGTGADARAVGLASDLLIFDNTFAENGSRYKNWESIRLTNGSNLTLDGRPLVLGGSDTFGGGVGIDASSSITAVGNASLTPFDDAFGMAALLNAGTLYLSGSTQTPTDRLTVVGNYVGLNGSLLLDTYLGSDGSASDRLVLAGTIGGLTGVGVINAGGPGAATLGSGIMVVEALPGAMTTGGVFALDRAVAAGAYEYLLFQGGVEANTQDNWYLRSSLIAVPPPLVPPPEPPQPPAPPPPPPPPPVEPPVPVAPVPVAPPPEPPIDEDEEAVVVPVVPPAPAPVDPQPIDPDPVFGGGIAEPTPISSLVVEPGAGVVAPTPGALVPGASLVAPGAAIPLYRLEAATYAVVPLAALRLGLEALGTLDERRGSQGYVADPEQPGWLRLYGRVSELGWSGTVAPVFDGHSYGVQAGMDLLSMASGDGTTTAGLFLGAGGMSGAVRGFALGWDNYAVGRLNLTSVQAGAYATYTDASGWYLDGVIMGSWLTGSARSTRGVGIDVSGLGLAASLEAGLPIALDGGWVLEPQGQVIWQSLSLNAARDTFANVSFPSTSGGTGRLGLRLERQIVLDNGVVTPAVFANLWQDFGRTETKLDADVLETGNDRTMLELGAGFTAELGSGVNLFGNASYGFGLGSEGGHSGRATVGLQVKF